MKPNKKNLKLAKELFVNVYGDPWRPDRRTEEARLPPGTRVRNVDCIPWLDDWQLGDPEPWDMLAELDEGRWFRCKAWDRPETYVEEDT